MVTVITTVLKSHEAGSSRRWLMGMMLAALMAGGCSRESAELRELRAENDRLKTALLDAQRTAAGLHDGSDTPVAHLDLSIAELWSERFEDNQFRSRHRLDQKQIRVTGLVDKVSERGVSIFADGTRFGSVTLLAQLDEEYVRQAEEGLAALRKGTEITVQGRFIYDKMGLQEAAIVSRKTGWRLTAKDLAEVPGAKAASAPEPVPPLVGRVLQPSDQKK